MTVDNINPEMSWLESRGGFDRYATGPEESTWFCGDCGTEVVDADAGCEHCGFSQHDNDNDEANDV